MPDVSNYVQSISFTGGSDGEQQGRAVYSTSYIVELLPSALSGGGSGGNPFAWTPAFYAKWAVINQGTPLGTWRTHIDAKNISRSPLHYEVTATYEQPAMRDATISPLDRPSLLSTAYEEFSEIFEVDADDKPVLNSAKCRFATAPERRNGHLILQVSKNLANIPLLYYDYLKYTLNAGSVSIRGVTFPASTLMFLPCTAQEVIESVEGTLYDYFQVTYRLATDSNQHKIILSNMGMKELVSVAGGKKEWRIIKDKDGIDTTIDCPLDLDGKAITTPEADPSRSEFKPYYTANWGIDFG